MNELIAKLAENATYEMEFGGDVLQTSNGEVSYEIPAGFVEAFAKLIVKEAINIMLHYTDVEEGAGVARMHFGVDE